jgi:hypothetical protein
LYRPMYSHNSMFVYPCTPAAFLPSLK